MIAALGEQTKLADVFVFVVSDGLFRWAGKGKWRKLAEAKDFDGALLQLTGAGKRRVALTQYMKFVRSNDGGRTWSTYTK